MDLHVKANGHLHAGRLRRWIDDTIGGEVLAAESLRDAS